MSNEDTLVHLLSLLLLLLSLVSLLLSRSALLSSTSLLASFTGCSLVLLLFYLSTAADFWFLLVSLCVNNYHIAALWIHRTGVLSISDSYGSLVCLPHAIHNTSKTCCSVLSVMCSSNDFYCLHVVYYGYDFCKDFLLFSFFALFFVFFLSSSFTVLSSCFVLFGYND